MNRLQKKCVIATTGFHLLLLVILFVGPAFFWSQEKPDDTPVLDMIPANLVDSASTPAFATPRRRRPRRSSFRRNRSAHAQPPAKADRPARACADAAPTLSERVEKFFKPDRGKADAGQDAEGKSRTKPRSI